MKTYRLNSLSSPVIAREGETGAVRVAVDCGAWADDFPSGSGVLLFRRPDGETYPLSAAFEPPYLCAALTASETAHPGLCLIEARWTVLLDGQETVIAKAGPFRLRVAPALGGHVLPAPEPSWLSRVLIADASAQSAAARAEAAAAQTESYATVALSLNANTDYTLLIT